MCIKAIDTITSGQWEIKWATLLDCVKSTESKIFNDD